MTKKVVQLKDFRKPESKARKAMLMAILCTFCEDCVDDEQAVRICDHLLGHLWIEGFVLVPRTGHDHADQPPILS
jgi:hypothetical protein